MRLAPREHKYGNYGKKINTRLPRPRFYCDSEGRRKNQTKGTHYVDTLLQAS